MKLGTLLKRLTIVAILFLSGLVVGSTSALHWLASKQESCIVQAVDLCVLGRLVWQNIFLPVFSFAAELAIAFTPWPALIIGVLVVIIRYPKWFEGIITLARRFARISVLGAEIEFNTESGKQIKAAAKDLTDGLKEYRSGIVDAVAGKVARIGLQQQVEDFIENELLKIIDKNSLPQGFRCTIHVPDRVLDGHLMQLLDYFPEGKGAGRPFSVRFGIIGKVWRSGQPHGVGNLIHGIASNAPEIEKLDKIVQDWGMTRLEARKALDHPSYVCLSIDGEHKRLGVFYMDATVTNAFVQEDADSDSRDELFGKLSDAIQKSGIVKSLSEIEGELGDVYLSVKVDG